MHHAEEEEKNKDLVVPIKKPLNNRIHNRFVVEFEYVNSMERLDSDEMLGIFEQNNKSIRNTFIPIYNYY